MRQTRLNTFLLTSVLATLGILMLPHLVSPKKLTVIPNDKFTSHLYTYKPEGSSASLEWIDQASSGWRCAIPEAGIHYSCNFILRLDDDTSKGINLSGYSRLRVKINYQGGTKRLRLGLRGFDPRFSTTTDPNSTKYHFVILSADDLNREIEINLRELTIADWWIMQYNLPRELARPDLSNVISVAVELSEILTVGNHDVQVEEMVFIGEWIKPEKWYLGVLVFWIFAVVAFVILRMLNLHLQTKAANKRIHELSDTNSSLQLERNRFQILSNLDALTGVLNRNAIDQNVQRLLLDSQRNSIALIMIDIDHFKAINDNRGHDAGDRVLKKFVEIISTNIRTEDMLGRWGGEEFILICPKTSIDNAFYLAEKIRKIIAGHVFEEENPLTVTASFGVATISLNEEFSDAFKRTDIALYNAKAKGRNCTVIADLGLSANAKP